MNPSPAIEVASPALPVLTADDHRAEPPERALPFASERALERDAEPNPELLDDDDEPPPRPASVASSPERRPAPVRIRKDVASPFVALPEHDLGPLDAMAAGALEPSVLVDLLREPKAVARRLLDADRAPVTVVAAMATVVTSAAVFAAAAVAARPGAEPLASAALMPVVVLMSLAAALGPIYVAGVLASVRLPLARLAGLVIAGAAPGLMVLATLSPLPWLAWRLDDTWAGPLSIAASMTIAGLCTGLRLHQITLALAEAGAEARGRRSLLVSERERVELLARLAFVFSAFCFLLGSWALDVFV
jgi:hypothetical protein